VATGQRQPKTSGWRSLWPAFRAILLVFSPSNLKSSENILQPSAASRGCQWTGSATSAHSDFPTTQDLVMHFAVKNYPKTISPFHFVPPIQFSLDSGLFKYSLQETISKLWAELLARAVTNARASSKSVNRGTFPSTVARLIKYPSVTCW